MKASRLRKSSLGTTAFIPFSFRGPILPVYAAAQASAPGGPTNEGGAEDEQEIHSISTRLYRGYGPGDLGLGRGRARTGRSSAGRPAPRRRARVRPRHEARPAARA